jgi:transcriptional regulator GlxA family with amidase domain
MKPSAQNCFFQSNGADRSNRAPALFLPDRTMAMAYPQQTTARAPASEPRKSHTGGLSPQREKLVKQLILERLGDSLEVTELAQACALSRSHFSRAFKCSTGLSPQDWIRQQRIALAKHLIQYTGLSLTQISLECGFCDQAHFCHIFTRSEGINPFAWRCQVVHGLKSKRSQPSAAPTGMHATV